MTAIGAKVLVVDNLGAHYRVIVRIGFPRYRGSFRTLQVDQQPLEAYAMIAACGEAYSLTRDLTWQGAARRCFEWFLGRNDLGQSLYDSSTGACCDALHPDRVNQNQGAESTLVFQLALAEMNRAESVLVRETKRSGTPAWSTDSLRSVSNSSTSQSASTNRGQEADLRFKLAPIEKTAN